MSSSPIELGDLVGRLARAHAALGDGARTPREAEIANRQPSRRGLYARRALAAGDQITAADVTALRPTGALGAEHAHQLIGQRARRAIAVGAPFATCDLAATGTGRGAA